ncbi:MAG TPA: hypothetical protein VH252_07910 [Chthoniobacterales bacterium]|nr:hypothetical protein [Chthoniobacterales bacterium]
MKTLCVLIAIALLWLGYRHFTAPIVYPAGVLIASEPEQTDLPNQQSIQHGDFQLKPLARFSIDARLLHSKRYRWDHQSALVPVDLAVGWGRMSDQSVLDQLKISQSMRFYWYEYRLPPPIPQDEIVRHSTNIHIIPANDTIASGCESLRAGELIHLEGELVEATGPGFGTWRSSLRRDDTGNGACELLLVENVSRLDADSVNVAKRLVKR